MYEFIKITDEHSKKADLKLLKEKELLNLNLYFVSENPKLNKLSPRVPKNERIETGVENGEIKRVCFAPSIEQCLKAINVDKGEFYYVYIPKGSLLKHKITKTKLNDVPDANETSEYWVLDDIEIQLLYKIKVSKIIDNKNSKYGFSVDYKTIDTYDIETPNILEDLAKMLGFKYKTSYENDIAICMEFSDYKIARKFATACTRFLNESLVKRVDEKVYYKLED